MDNNPPRPSACVILDDGRIRFLRSRGKSTGNESFGYRSGNDRYLYIEEAVYLFDRGVLEVEDSNGKSLTLSDLHQRLPQYGILLPYLLVYQHLRMQTFCVLRHSSEKQEIIRQIEERFAELDPQPPRNSRSMQNDKVLSELRKKLRVHAQCPGGGSLGTIAFDCYEPGHGAYSSSCPRIPDFCVAITHYTKSTDCITALGFDGIRNLLQEAKTNLKIATVSDSGIVIMLGVTAAGVPILNSGGDD